MMPAPSYVSCGPFKMNADGLYFEKTIANGKTVPVFVSFPFEVLGMCRNPQSYEWGLLLRWQDFDRHLHEKRLPATLMHGDAAALCQALADGGLGINRNQHKALADYLCRASVSSRAMLVYRTGWHEIDGRSVFALSKDVVIGPHEGERIILDGVAAGPYASKGTPQEWKDSVGSLSSGHTLAVLTISMALAGPLLHLAGIESGGIHLLGSSSIGKSSLQRAAASVWGLGDVTGLVRSWRATANGLEGLAVSSSDTLLVLDELSQMSAHEMGHAVYMLANGAGKARAVRDGSLRDPKTFRLLILSSGEVDIEAKINEDKGRKAKAGQLVRMLCVRADRGKGFGVFDHPGPENDGGQLAQALSREAARHYGTAGPVLVRQIVEEGVETIAEWVRGEIDAFVADHAPRGADGQISRAAKRFGLIAAGGELACRFGIVPWETGEALDAAVWEFTQWLEGRGGFGPAEERMAIAQVRHFFELHGESRFERIGGDRPTINRAGWTKGQDANQEWFVSPEVWRTEVCAGLDPVLTAKILAGKGMLKRRGDGELRNSIKIGGRVYRAYNLTASIRDSEEEDGRAPVTNF
jgi:putative DNA primase/helicase